MPPCVFFYWSTFHGKHVIFNFPVGVVAGVAAAAVAGAVTVAVVVVVVVAVVVVIHGLIEPRVTKCLATYRQQPLVLMA